MINLADTNNCTGCTACIARCPNDCIIMSADREGFLYPEIDAEKCVQCGLCGNSCPIMHVPPKSAVLPEAFAAYSRDDLIRQESSSGGIFTELAKIVLKNGGAVFGASYDEQFNVVHTCVEHEDELEKLRGAKYAQSDLSGVFRQIKKRLDQNQQVLFSGTPCQVAGLKAYLREDHERLITLDFVCHSIPSPMAWHEYVKYRAMKDNNGQIPTKINLRSKKSGWSRYRYSNLFEYENGMSHVVPNSNSLYMKLFVEGFISRKSCEHCAFKGYTRISDITIGDFWGIWDILPELDDNKGTSVVLVQSEKGEAILRAVAGQLILKGVTLEEASRQNSAMLSASAFNPMRQQALEMIRKGKIAECGQWFDLTAPSILERVSRRICRLFGKA